MKNQCEELGCTKTARHFRRDRKRVCSDHLDGETKIYYRARVKQEVYNVNRKAEAQAKKKRANV